VIEDEPVKDEVFDINKYKKIAAEFD